jgi:hypothetical protein
VEEKLDPSCFEATMILELFGEKVVFPTERVLTIFEAD